MALVFENITSCLLCGKLLSTGDKVTSLPAISDTGHPHFKFFDRGYHTDCFNKWSEKEFILQLLREDRHRYVDSEEFKEFEAKYGKPKWLTDEK